MIIITILAAALAAVFFKKLTPAAGIAGAVVGILLNAGTGIHGILLLALFFVAGTVATAWKKDRKPLSASAGETRTVGQVLANGGVAAVAGAIGSWKPHYSPICLLAAAGSLSAACSDTLSSELGTVYGKRFYNILSWKRDQRGWDGVISAEGCWAGIAGALLIALPYGWASGSVRGAVAVWMGGVLGNLADSALGASLERGHRIGNNTVNLLNTAVGALSALAIAMV